MTRILGAVLLLLLLGQTTGAMSFLVGCDEQCSEEQGGAASCLPGCTQCACCGMSRGVLDAPLVRRPNTTTVERVWPEPVRAIAAPAPQEIGHVPKRLLA